jgi:hypothetical protein
MKRDEKFEYPIWSFANMFVVGAFALVTLVSGVGLLQIVHSDLDMDAISMRESVERR